MDILAKNLVIMKQHGIMRQSEMDENWTEDDAIRASTTLVYLMSSIRLYVSLMEQLPMTQMLIPSVHARLLSLVGQVYKNPKLLTGIDLSDQDKQEVSDALQEANGTINALKDMSDFLVKLYEQADMADSEHLMLTTLIGDIILHYATESEDCECASGKTMREFDLTNVMQVLKESGDTLRNIVDDMTPDNIQATIDNFKEKKFNEGLDRLLTDIGIHVGPEKDTDSGERKRAA